MFIWYFLSGSERVARRYLVSQRRHPMLGRRLLAAAFFLAGPALANSPAWAQVDAATMSLIEKLKPSNETRGIKRSSSASTAAPAAAAPAAAAPAGTIVAPIEPTRPAPVPAAAAPAAPAPAAPAPVARREAPSASITVTFPTGSAELTPEARRALQPLGNALSSADLAPYRFRIEGHTDTVGSPATNHALSERRAASVRDYLSANFGVSADRLESVGLGDTALEVPTPPQTPEIRNRRVKIVNLGS
jgi:outer membrane protein OmpA-like peptidoglycan-associated protein